MTTVERILEYQQNPVDSHTTLEDLQERIQQLMRKHLARAGGGAGSGGGGIMNSDGSGHYSVQGFDEDGAHLTLAVRYFGGNKLELAERVNLSPDSGLLLYRLDISGPDGKHSRYEVEFQVLG